MTTEIPGRAPLPTGTENAWTLPSQERRRRSGNLRHAWTARLREHQRQAAQVKPIDRRSRRKDPYSDSECFGMNHPLNHDQHSPETAQEPSVGYDNGGPQHGRCKLKAVVFIREQFGSWLAVVKSGIYTSMREYSPIGRRPREQRHPQSSLCAENRERELHVLPQFTHAPRHRTVEFVSDGLCAPLTLRKDRDGRLRDRRLLWRRSWRWRGRYTGNGKSDAYEEREPVHERAHQPSRELAGRPTRSGGPLAEQSTLLNPPCVGSAGYTQRCRRTGRPVRCAAASAAATVEYGPCHFPLALPRGFRLLVP